jgi:hypothetical protein
MSMIRAILHYQSLSSLFYSLNSINRTHYTYFVLHIQPAQPDVDGLYWIQIEDFVELFNRVYIVTDKSIPVENPSPDDPVVTSKRLLAKWIPGDDMNGSRGPPMVLPRIPKVIRSLALINNNMAPKVYASPRALNRFSPEDSQSTYAVLNSRAAGGAGAGAGGAAVPTLDSTQELNGSFFWNPAYTFNVVEWQTSIVVALYQADRRWSVQRLGDDPRSVIAANFTNRTERLKSCMNYEHGIGFAVVKLPPLPQPSQEEGADGSIATSVNASGKNSTLSAAARARLTQDSKSLSKASGESKRGLLSPGKKGVAGEDSENLPLQKTPLQVLRETPFTAERIIGASDEVPCSNHTSGKVVLLKGRYAIIPYTHVPLDGGALEFVLNIQYTMGHIEFDGNVEAKPAEDAAQDSKGEKKGFKGSPDSKSQSRTSLASSIQIAPSKGAEPLFSGAEELSALEAEMLSNNNLQGSNPVPPPGLSTVRVWEFSEVTEDLGVTSLFDEVGELSSYVMSLRSEVKKLNKAVVHLSDMAADDFYR